MSDPKWPNADVQLVGENGNAFSILARAGSAIRRAYGPDAEDEYIKEATSGDYNHLLYYTITNLNTEQADTWDDDETDSWGDRYEDYDEDEDDN